MPVRRTRTAARKKAAPRKKATAKRKVAKKPATRRKTTARKAAPKRRTTARKAAPKRKTAARKAAPKRKPAARKAAPKRKATARKAAPKRKPAKTKTKRKPNAAFMKPMQPSAKLAEVVGGKPMPRTEVTKQLWKYIKKHGLQDATKRTMINADAALKAVFNGRTQVSMFEMTKLVSKHLKDA